MWSMLITFSVQQPTLQLGSTALTLIKTLKLVYKSHVHVASNKDV